MNNRCRLNFKETLIRNNNSLCSIDVDLVGLGARAPTLINYGAKGLENYSIKSDGVPIGFNNMVFFAGLC